MNDLYDVRVQFAQEHYRAWIKQIENDPGRDIEPEAMPKNAFFGWVGQLFQDRKQTMTTNAR